MPFTTNPPTTAYNPSKPLPHHLAHKPVYALPYEYFDGPYAPSTDVQFITVGIAQYDPCEVSIKTMRYVSGKWSRQAEELPLHRPIDMTLLLAKTIFPASASTVNIPAGSLPRQTSDINITMETAARSTGEIATYNAAVAAVNPILLAGLNSLLVVLQDLKSRGRI